MSTAKKKLTTCEPKTAVAYARYSSAKQRDVSIEQQIKDIRAFAEREGYTIIHEYADHARSGFKRSDLRAEFQEMLLAAESGSFDTVIAWKVDRFGRDRRESATYKGRLADLGVSVIYAMEPIPEGAAGCLTEGMLESIAEWYSRNLSENTKRGQNDNAMKCITNGQTPYGYKVGPDKRFIISEPEAAVVRRIYDYYSKGYSYTAIAQKLNEEGLKTRLGLPYHRTTVMYIMQNDSYIGVYHYGGITVPGGMPAIISQDLWDICQVMKTKKTKKHGKSEFNYYLAGKCTCGICGSNMYATYAIQRNGKRMPYYACGRKKATKDCPSHFRRKETIEEPIFNFLINDVLKGDVLESFIDEIMKALKVSHETSPQKLLEEELKRVNKKIENIHKAICDGIWIKQTGEMLEQLSATAEKLQHDLAYRQMTEGRIASKDKIRFMFNKIANGDYDKPECRQMIVNTLINSVTIYDDWIRVAVNCIENVGRINPDDLPPLEKIPEVKRIGNCTVSGRKLYIVDPYPVIVFKIAV